MAASKRIGIVWPSVRSLMYSLLTVHSDVEHIICLDEVDVFRENLDALFVVDYGAGGLFFAAEALARLLNDAFQCWPVIIAEVYYRLLRRLVYTSI